ncbi:MAG: hypothetical protein WD770_11410 [Actinomycetota bacterium]
MSDQARCPNCGALVVSDARWCGQCYAPLGAAAAPAPEPVTGPEPQDDLGLDAAIDWSEVLPEGSSPPAPSFPTGGGVDTRLSVRRVGEDLVWDCPSCGRENPMALSECAACQTPFATLLRREEAEAAPKLEPGQAILRSLLLTGLGHMSMGRAADGIARLVLFLWATGLGVIMLMSPSNSGPILAVGGLFVVSAVAIWAVTALDASRLAKGDEEQLLGPRVLLVGTIALTVLSIGAFVAGANQAGSIPTEIPIP